MRSCSQEKNIRTKYPDNFIAGLLNVNGLRNKFIEIHSLLCKESLNVLGLCETKIDDSFPDAQFHIENYQLYRKDRNSRGGGLLLYVQGNMPHRRRLDLEVTTETTIEHIVLELIMKKEKVFIVLAYRPPSHPVEPLTALLSCVIDKCLIECKTVYVMGDLNVNCITESHALTELFETFDLSNIVKGPTCFKSVTNPSLVDVILTNTPARVLSHVNTDIDVSDFHNLVCVITRMHAPKTQTRVITYRSYKRMDDQAFIDDLAQAPLHVSNIFDDVDDQLWFHNTLVRNVIDEHAPLKQKKLKCSQVP